MFPIHLNVYFKVLYFYEGFYFLISILVGLYWGRKRIQANDIDVEKFDSLIFWALVFAMVGARLSHFMFWDTNALLNNPLILFKVWGGGASVTGGLAGGMITGYIYARKIKISFWKVFVSVSPAILLAQAVGRVGCFLNGDAHGIATTLPFGVKFPKFGMMIPGFYKNTTYTTFPWNWSFRHGLIDSTSKVSASLHPTQLYEAFGDLVLVAILLFFLKKVKGNDRVYKIVFFIHTGGYSLLRFFLEFIRGDRGQVVFANMSFLQFSLLTYAIFSFAGITLLAIKNREEAV